MGLYDRENLYKDQDKYNPMKFDYNLRQLPPIGNIIINEIDISRPWLIAFKCYGIEKLWWWILRYNNVINLSSLQPGDRLEYPDISKYKEIYTRYTKK